MAPVGQGDTQAPHEVQFSMSKLSVEMISCTLTPSASKAAIISFNLRLSTGTSTTNVASSGFTCASRILIGMPDFMIVLANIGRLVSVCL
jgi:hypothetical protein